MADIGSTLREARMRARIDMSEVEARTKIRAKYLRAIENEEWNLLPGPIYAKSFLRTYSNFLGLDSRMLLDEFKRRYEAPYEPDARPISALARERERAARGPRIPAWAPIAVAIVVILVILYVVGSFSQSGPSAPSGHHKAPPHRARPVHHAAPPVRTTPALPSRATLSLTPTGTVYVCLVNGSGAKLINQQIFGVGQHIPSASGSQLLLTLGNASATIKANGKTVPIAPSSAAIRLLITPAGVRHIPLSRKPTCP